MEWINHQQQLFPEMSPRNKAIQWAFDRLQERDQFCILDTETTGLDHQAQVVEIAVTDGHGNELFNQRVKPSCGIEIRAFLTHHIGDEDLKDAPTFDQIWVDLVKAIDIRDVVIYNADFDLRLIQQSARARSVPLEYHRELLTNDLLWVNGAKVHCAMSAYSAFCGEWSDYHQNFKWQRLPGGDHTALGDCLATLKVIELMAGAV